MKREVAINPRAEIHDRAQGTGDFNHSLPIASNLLDRNINPAEPNQIWTSDITYSWTDEGWPYLAIVFDLFNHEIIGWSLKPSMTWTPAIVIDTLTMEWLYKRPAAGLMYHSDWGSQYASYAFQKELEKYGMICSMSRKGNC